MFADFANSSPELALKSGDESKFTVLAPGESFEVTHELAGVYNFTRSGAGDYNVSILAWAGPILALTLVSCHSSLPPAMCFNTWTTMVNLLP